jgi:predicted amidohydrolase
MEYGYCQVLSSKKAKVIYNTASVINPQGEVVTRYRKNVSILSL